MAVYYIEHNDRIASDKKMDAILRRHPELPSHFISVLMGRQPLAALTRNRLAQRAARGELIRYDPKNRTSKHSSYCLNEPGNRDTKKRPHRILESMMKASVEIGVMQRPAFEYIAWDELVLSPSMPRETLDIMDRGKNPHLIPLRAGHLLPDGDPFRLYHEPSDSHINIVDEVDRNTEPLTTKEERRNIEGKFERYDEFFKRKLWKSHYGFKNCLVRFLTTDEANMRGMMRLYENRFGASAHTLFGTIKDYFYEVSYPPADGVMFTYPYKRIGFPDYHLNRFFEMDR